MTTSTSSSAMTSAWITSLIEPLTNTVSSMLMPMRMSAGSDSFTSAISAFTPLATSSTLAVDCGMMPMLTDGLPSERATLRRSSAASSTSATSPRRTM